MLHKYANEDVSLGSWFIGLDVDHVDDRKMCCGTPPGMLIIRMTSLSLIQYFRIIIYKSD